MKEKWEQNLKYIQGTIDENNTHSECYGKKLLTMFVLVCFQIWNHVNIICRISMDQQGQRCPRSHHLQFLLGSSLVITTRPRQFNRCWNHPLMMMMRKQQQQQQQPLFDTSMSIPRELPSHPHSPVILLSIILITFSIFNCSSKRCTSSTSMYDTIFCYIFTFSPSIT